MKKYTCYVSTMHITNPNTKYRFASFNIGDMQEKNACTQQTLTLTDTCFNMNLQEILSHSWCFFHQCKLLVPKSVFTSDYSKFIFVLAYFTNWWCFVFKYVGLLFTKFIRRNRQKGFSPYLMLWDCLVPCFGFTTRC